MTYGARFLIGIAALLAGCCPRTEGRLHIKLELERSPDPGEVRVRYSIRNLGHDSVWIPVEWGVSDPPSPLPVGFIVPPANLLLVFGKIEMPAREDLILEGWPVITAKRLTPGSSQTGHFSISVPYAANNWIEEDFNVYRRHVAVPFQWETGVKIEALESVEIGVQYYLLDPKDGGMEWEDSVLYRRGVVRGVVEQQLAKGAKLMDGVSVKYAVSNRIRLNIPLREGIELFREMTQEDPSGLFGE